MATASPYNDPKSRSGASVQLLRRLEQCWNEKLNWDLFPSDLKEVNSHCGRGGAQVGSCTLCQL